MTSGKVTGANRKSVGLSGSRRVNESHTREALLNRFPEADNLSIYDGRTLLGFIVDLGSRKPSYGYAVDGRSIGAFRTRTAAMAAVGGAS